MKLTVTHYLDKFSCQITIKNHFFFLPYYFTMEALGKLFETRMQEYERKLQKVAEGSSVHSDVTVLSQDFNDFKSMIWQLFNNVKSKLECLSLGLDTHEMIMRRKVLLFHGIEEKCNEKLPEVIYQVIAEQLKLPDIPKSNLQVCHHLGVSAQAKSRPVLVRFTALEPRQAVWDAKTLLKGTGITISEFLTRTRHQIFLSARKHFGIKNCWSAEGKIALIFLTKYDVKSKQCLLFKILSPNSQLAAAILMFLLFLSM